MKTWVKEREGNRNRKGKADRENYRTISFGCEETKAFRIKTGENKAVMYPRDALLMGMEDLNGKGETLASGFSLFQHFGCWHLNLNCWVSSICVYVSMNFGVCSVHVQLSSNELVV